MATTDKSTKHKNLKEQKNTSITSKTQVLEKNSSNELEGISGLVRGKLYYVKAAPSFFEEEHSYVTVQLVEPTPENPNTCKDSNKANWLYRCYLVDDDCGSIRSIDIKASQLLDKEFIDGELNQCLS